MFLANLLIALRESLEAALVVGIIAAYLVKAERRDVFPKLWLGVGLAALLPLALGAVLTWGPQTLTFQAQEIIGGGLSLVAVGLVTWMILWMGLNSRELKGEIGDALSNALGVGYSGWGVVWIAIVAVGREGMATALFIWATVKSSIEKNTAATTAGVVVGLILGAALGWAIYAGAVRFNLSRFFTISGYFLVVVAAGIVSYGVGDLQEAGVIPGITNHAYNFSSLVTAPAVNWLYALLSAMFQLNANPTVLQVIAWWAYLIPVLFIFYRISSFRPVTSSSTRKAQA